MSRLVVCCDGTWQDATDRSNVSRLCDAVVRADDDPPARYVRGVGAGGNRVTRLRAGLSAAGLDASIREAYGWLVETARPGDRIVLFGYSRGAYTARSVAGMISRVGLIDGAGRDERWRAAAVARAYARYRRIRDVPVDDGWAGELPFLHRPGDRPHPVQFIGVWDTVGALGIPAYVGIPDVFGSRRRYEFLDVDLNPAIPHARHAVSLDEMRGPFRPTLWGPAADGQVLRQVWFPGDHGDVGGGHADHRLSDVALRWMADEAAAATGLAFDLDRPGDFDPSPLGAAHTMTTGLRGVLHEIGFQPRPRAVPRVDAAHRTPDVADAAYARQLGNGYRSTTTLAAAGDRTLVEIPADRSWTGTGVHLPVGTYEFVADGEWSSAGERCGPDGVTSWRHASGRAFSTVVGGIERLLRRVVGNTEAELAGTRRESDMPWLSLVGIVANEQVETVAGAPPGEPAIRTLPDEKFLIGVRRKYTTQRAGYLHAYPNDALGFYGNNDGRLTLTVTRIG